MAERRKTPDILADLLGDKSAEPTATAEKPVRQQADLPANQQNGLPANQQNGERNQSSHPTLESAQGESGEEHETHPSSKLKVTFYLSEESVDLLEEAQRQLRRLSRGDLKPHSKAATSKSALLEAALKLACADLESRGKESQFAILLF